MSKKSNSRLVFSTETGRHCPECNQTLSQCICSKQEAVKDPDAITKIRLETKGRKGKGVTLIEGLPLASNELKILAKQLKQLCGTGGAVKGDCIEIQGDKRDIIYAALNKDGFKVKRAGG